MEHGLGDGDDCFREIYKAVGYAVAPLPLPTCPNLLCGNSVAWKLIVPEESSTLPKLAADICSLAERMLQPFHTKLTEPTWFILQKARLLLRRVSA